MIADAATHDSIYAAVLGGMALILAAAVANWFATRKGRAEARDAADKAQETGRKVEAMEEHLPPNGDRLYHMVEATNRSVNHIRDKLDRVEGVMLAHLSNHEGQGGRS